MGFLFRQEGNIAGQLAEVVFEVGDVVDEHEAEGDLFSFVMPDVREAGGVGVLDGVGEVAVEGEEEGEDLGPGQEVVALEGDPLGLLVAGEDELGRELEADEALVVVGAGVDEVADGFPAWTTCRGRGGGRLCEVTWRRVGARRG